MKKLMIAAAVAAMTAGAFAGEDDCTADCPWAYKMKMVMRTTTSGLIASNGVSVCKDECYRKPTMGKIVGYIYGYGEEEEGGCKGCGCNEWADGSIVLWNNYSHKPFTVTSLDVVQLNRIGKDDRSVAEAVFTLNMATGLEDLDITPSLALAGFGPCGHLASGKVAIRSLSGFFAGQWWVACSSCTGCQGEQTCESTPAACWDLCTGAQLEAGTAGGDGYTAAYGKWKLAWDSDVVRRMTVKGWVPTAPYGYVAAAAEQIGKVQEASK